MVKYSLDRILSQLIKHEGLVCTPYKDSKDISTIGIGRNLVSPSIDRFELERLGFGPSTEPCDIKNITEHDAKWLCANDIYRCEKELFILENKGFVLKSHLPVLKNVKLPFSQLSAVRQMVLVNMSFNLGFARLKLFERMFIALEELDFIEAAKEILDSKAARNLTKRYSDLALIMREG